MPVDKISAENGVAKATPSRVLTYQAPRFT